MRSARVAALYAAAMPTYYGSIAVGAFLLAALWSAYSSKVLLGWFAALVAVMLMRAAVHWRYARTPAAEHDAGRWESRYVRSTLAAGAVWTYVPAALFPETDALLQAAVVIVVGGVIISGAALCAASRSAVYGLITLPLAALIARLLLQPDRIHRLLAVAILLFGFVIVRMSGEIRRSIVEAFGARLHNEQLLERVRESEEKLRSAAEEARFLAYHDALTGLPNRRLLDDRLRQAVFQAQRHDARLAVMLIDLDDFKLVNDSAGHRAGDAVLREVAVRLGGCVRKADTLARHGGDEFVVVIADVQAQADCQVVAEKILHVLAGEFRFDGARFVLGASIGISIFPADAGDADTLLRHADAAMYLAKQLGRNQYRFHGR